MILSDDLKLIFLDFDGVLIRSNAIKDEAFDTVLRTHLSNYPDDLLNQAREFHLANNAIPRLPKFQHIANSILGVHDDDLVAKMVSDFGRFTTSALIACEYVVGALEFLKYWHSRVPLIVVSATPQAALEEIIVSRGMSSYFSQIVGAGLPKARQIAHECVSRNIAPGNTLFIGDSPEDYLSAVTAGTRFIGIYGRTDFSDVDVASFIDLRAAQQWLLDESVTHWGSV